MNTAKELRNEMISVFNQIRTDKIDLKKAKELTNAAGKILNTVKVQLTYNQLMDRKEKIDFLEC
jgi:hypothetical protein